MFSHINSSIHVGKTAILDVDREIYHGVNLMLFRPHDFMSSWFLDYYMKMIFGSGYWRKICKQSVNQASVNQKDIKKVPIHYPPLPEQKRIVAILDEAFEGIAAATANAEKNLANARELFESYLNAVFTQKGEGWVEKRIDQIGTTQTGSTPKTSERANYGNAIPFVKPADFNADGSLDYDNDGLSEEGLAAARKVAARSVLMVCIGATIGKCGYCDRSITTNQQINALTPTEGSSDRFVYYQMLTEEFQQRVIRGSSQATLPIINKSKWSALPVWLPPTVAEQHQIVAKLSGLSEETVRLETIYQHKLDDLAELKQSFLHKAFAGELTAQPDQEMKEAVG